PELWRRSHEECCRLRYFALAGWFPGYIRRHDRGVNQGGAQAFPGKNLPAGARTGPGAGAVWNMAWPAHTHQCYGLDGRARRGWRVVCQGIRQRTRGEQRRQKSRRRDSARRRCANILDQPAGPNPFFLPESALMAAGRPAADSVVEPRTDPDRMEWRAALDIRGRVSCRLA